MNEKCNECGICCYNTEMILSESDIKLILTKSYIPNLKESDFITKNNGTFYKLKNINNYCYFFEITSKKCKIYDIRPQGCRFYPMIYDQDKEKCILDNDCERKELFYQDSIKFTNTCLKLKEFLKKDLLLKK